MYNIYMYLWNKYLFAIVIDKFQQSFNRVLCAKFNAIGRVVLEKIN